MKQLAIIEGNVQLKCWNRAISCVTKLGEYVSFDITSETVAIGAFNISASALASMKFSKPFFRTFKTSGDVGSGTQFKAQFQLHSKTLNSIFRRIEKDSSSVQICKILFTEQSPKRASRKRQRNSAGERSLRKSSGGGGAKVNSSPGLFVGDSDEDSDDRSYLPTMRTDEALNETEMENENDDEDLYLDLEDEEDDVTRTASITMDVEMVCENGLSKFFSTPCMDTRQVYNDTMDKQKCSGWFRCDSKFLKSCLDHVTGRPEEVELEFDTTRISLTTLTRGINIGKEILKFPMSTRIDIEPDQMDCMDVKIGSRLCIRHKEFMVMIAFAESLMQMNNVNGGNGRVIQKMLMFDKNSDPSAGKVMLDAYIYKAGYPMSYELSSSMIPDGAKFKFLFLTMAIDDEEEDEEEDSADEAYEDDREERHGGDLSAFVPYSDNHKHSRLVKKIGQPFYVTEKRGPGVMPATRAHRNLTSFTAAKNVAESSTQMSSTPMPTITMSDLESDGQDADDDGDGVADMGTVTWNTREEEVEDDDYRAENLNRDSALDLAEELRHAAALGDAGDISGTEAIEDADATASTMAIGPTQGATRARGLFD